MKHWASSHHAIRGVMAWQHFLNGSYVLNGRGNGRRLAGLSDFNNWRFLRSACEARTGNFSKYLSTNLVSLNTFSRKYLGVWMDPPFLRTCVCATLHRARQGIRPNRSCF